MASVDPTPTRRTPRARPLSAAHVVAVGLVAFAVFALATVVAGRQPGPAVGAPSGDGSTTASSGSTTADDGSTSASTAGSVAGAVDPSPAATAVATVAVVPHVDGKPRLYTAGDSTAGGLGSALQPLVDTMGVEQQLDYKNSTGLTRPDFFDWPARLTQQVAALTPDVAVVMFGGNDAQAIALPDGRKVNVDNPEWSTEYAKRVGSTMELLTQGGRKLIWVGVTSAKSDSFEARLEVLRNVLVQQAAAHPDVVFVDPWTMFNGPDGAFADYVVDDDGIAKSMRSKEDGFHLNPTGAKRLARAVAAKVAELTGKPALPAVANPNAGDGYQGVYVVQPGDAWGLVAQRLGVSLDVLLETNGATPKTPLFVDQKVKVPTPIVLPEVVGPAITIPAASTPQP